MQELKKNRRLVEGKVNLQLSNEVRVVALAVKTSYALAVETSYFGLPNRLILELYNCYFVPVF
jgi:hypothetical protein